MLKLFATVVFLSIAADRASAQTLTPAEEAAEEKFREEEAEKPGFKIYGWVESSFTGNPAGPNDNQNFGRLFDDRSNEFVMNQAVINAERVLDSKLDFDWGFKLQLLFGTDARYIYSLGMRYHNAGTGHYQGDIPEAYLSLQLPLLTEGGLEVKLGKFVSLEGAESVDPRENPFFSHTYIFNFGVPTSHTGALFTLHTTSWLDLIAGVTRGVNTSIDDNNNSPAFHGGVGLSFNEEKLVVLASTHIGPESDDNDTDPTYFNDITVTWKMTDKFTSITDLNYVRDSEADADAYGVARYFTYTINDKIAVGVRGEVWRYDKGAYVAQYANPSDPSRSFSGASTVDPRTVDGARTTYGALTIGLNIKLPMPKPLRCLTIRPELRVDHAFDDRPFNDSSDDTMFTAAPCSYPRTVVIPIRMIRSINCG